MSECRHGLNREWCVTCKVLNARTAMRQHLPPGWAQTEAAYDSRCPACGGMIDAGERIYRPTTSEVFLCESCSVHDYRLLR